MQPVTVTLERDETPDELTDRLRDELVRFWLDTLLREYPSVVLHVAALFGSELGKAGVIVMGERRREMSWLAIQQHQFVYLPRGIVTGASQIHQIKVHARDRSSPQIRAA